MDERRCLREQMNGSDSEQCHGLLQKKRGVSTASRDEHSEVKTVMNVLLCTIFLGQCCPISTADMEKILKSATPHVSITAGI